MKPQKLGAKLFIASSFSLLICLGILASIFEIKFGNFLKFPTCSLGDSPGLSYSSTTSSINLGSVSASPDDIRILIGILTLPGQYDRRHFLRQVYGVQTPSLIGAQVDLKFVFCNLTNEEHKVLVSLEIMRYDDIIILNCTENMNEGKTYTYFSSLPEMLNSTDRPYPPYHYVMKADDDIFIRLQKLVESLKALPREDLYYGYVIPCESMDPFKMYMSGMGFAVSWDIVEWIKDSDIPRNNIIGAEDQIFGEWMRKGNRAKNRHNAKWSMYDYPQPPNKCTHELWPDTIAVHRLKSPQKWIHTLTYFNVTRDLKPSKFYHMS